MFFFYSGLLKNQGYERDDIFAVVVHGCDLDVEQRIFLSIACCQIELNFGMGQKCLSALLNVNYLKNKPFNQKVCRNKSFLKSNFTYKEQCLNKISPQIKKFQQGTFTFSCAKDDLYLATCI